MKEVFASKLKSLRAHESKRHWLNKNFAGELMNSPWFLDSLPLERSESADQVVKVELATSEQPEVALTVNETVMAPKVETVQSEPAAPQKKSSFQELSKTSKEKPELSDFKLASEYNSFNDYLKDLNPAWTMDMIPGLEDFDQQVDILFYGEKHILDPMSEDFPPHSLFNNDRDLLGKMIGAMKIANGRFIRSSIFFSDERSKEKLAYEIQYFKPKFVMTLGASALNLALGRKERLSIVHGQNFQGQINGKSGQHNYSIVPLFHPDFLEINPSMKRTTWIDMQKVMEQL
ncbi:uracil-DNA glycosylase family protein [Halobacteriovorax sp. GB3]|uniref:uracil-DNA glycosylase family protein n=1 Tax=Halobacteriovorax sp. GB3 TaxID=2719615 RepID=UPI002361280E|nr:uracil-DNA glycosylase family protein [Halobacteriovorax sp. GB3]MDD0854127.1 uracil-DNA glycosylase family protein [Halobacteriovorax sp. GB3]